MQTSKKEFLKLLAIAREIAHLQSAASLLAWDQETHMPAAGIEARAVQRQILATLIHKQKISGRFVTALAKLVDLKSGQLIDSTLPPREAAALREWHRDYARESRLPPSFVKTFAHTTSLAVQAWTGAKQENQFSSFAPHLKKIIALTRKKAELLGYTEHPYDALLDLYEPGLKTSTLTTLFGKIQPTITELLQEITAAPPIDRSLLFGDFAPQKQLHLSRLLLETLGADRDHCQIDLTEHPFCTTLHPTDVRVTTHINPNLLTSCLLAVLHEGGHALYGLGLSPEAFGSPLAESASIAFDESQSRWWETLVGMGLPFWTYFFPHLQQAFPEKFGATHLEEFYRALNSVQPSFIRIEADELTYPLHIILRFEIEKALIEGSLEVNAIPQAWNSRMRAFFGIEPKTDGEGCLQDIHWAMGGFGYFPSYILGNLYATQLFHTYEKAHPTWKEEVAAGQCAPMRTWLRDSIHHHGRTFLPEDLILRITGEPLSEQPYLNYLQHKYRRLYRMP